MRSANFFFLIITIFPILYTSAQEMELASKFNHVPYLPQQLWDLKFNYDMNSATGGLGNAAVIYIPSINRIWTSRWATSIFHIWDSTGTVVDSFNLYIKGTRSMCFDGQYVYCAIDSNILIKVDPQIHTTVSGSITVPESIISGARFVTYEPSADSGRGGFWIGNWNPDTPDFYLISRTGILLSTKPNTLSAIYNIAYDNISQGGSFLWVFTQGEGPGYPQYIKQYNLLTGQYTSVLHDVKSDVGSSQPSTGLAGGLFITTVLLKERITLGGVLQGYPDRLFGYDLGNFVTVKDLNSISTSGYILENNYPNPFNPSTKISYSIPKSGNISLKVYDLLGREVAALFNGFRTKGSYEVNFDGSKLNSGVYLYVLNTDDTHIAKKMIFLK